MSVQNGCSPRITDNSTITELDPVTMQQFTLSTGEADQDGRVIEKTGTSTPPTDEKIVITGDQDLTEREVTVIETSDEASKTPTPSPTVVTGKDTSGDQDGAVRDTVSETENLDTPTPSPTDVTDKDTSGDQGGTVRDTVSETEDLDTPTPSPTDVTGKDTSGDQEGTVRDTVSETTGKVTTWFRQEALPATKRGFSKYIWNLEGAEVRASYNAEIAEGYSNSTFGKAAFDALQDGTPITKEHVEEAVAFREKVKTNHQNDSAYLEWVLIQDRQLYEYHFQDKWNKGDYTGALKAFWAGLGQIRETGSANPTIANLEALGKSPESIACGAFTPNAGLNTMFGVKPPKAECRDVIGAQPKAPRGWSAPVVYTTSQVVVGGITYKVVRNVVWPILSTLGSLLLCCRRGKKAEPKAADPVATTFDNTLWTTTDHKLSNAYTAPNAFDKVAKLTIGETEVKREGAHNRLAETARQMNVIFEANGPLRDAALKVVAYMAAHDLLVEAQKVVTDEALDWSKVEDGSVTATIKKSDADNKISFVVSARIKAADYQVHAEYDSPEAMQAAANLMT
ncbi:hypothetical protein [Simkania sp.]|uniref:hypothetical protein n=1 Tax=Simkania sp. TaxID=34094 RepID=UPI003B51689B